MGTLKAGKTRIIIGFWFKCIPDLPSMKIIQSCFFGLSKLGMMKWSLKMMRSAWAESLLLVLMTHVDTGHCSLRNTPGPA